MITKAIPYLLLAALADTASAQQSITLPRTAVTQNFDSLLTSASATLPTGWRRGEVWASGATDLTQAAGTSGTGVVASGSNGGAYNWANGVTATATDRAPGFLSAALFTSPCYLGYAFTNNTGETIRALDLSWNYEKYRSGTRAFDWTFEHGSASASLTAASAGAQAYPADANNTTVTNLPASIPKSFRLSGLSIAPGSTYYLRWTYTGAGGSSNAQGLGIDDFSLTPIAPVLGSPASPSSFSANYLSPSTAQTISVTGSELAGPVTVTAPSYFEVSTDGVTYAASVSVPAASLPTSVSVRLAATAPANNGLIAGNLTLASDGALTRSIDLSGTVIPPVITPSVTTLSGFSADYGSVSSAQSFSVAVSNPVGPVEVIVPSGFEVSTNGNSYAPGVSLPAASLPATVSVRLAATAPGGVVTGSITLTHSGAIQKSVALTGSVRGVLTPSITTLTGFQSVQGTASTAQTFTLNGGGLSGALNITVPAGYEFSINGGDFGTSSALGAAVTQILSTNNAFAALKSDGSVVTWGSAGGGGDSSSVASRLTSGVATIYTNGFAFAALKSDGSVVTWGASTKGGNSSSVASQLATGVTCVHALEEGFAASKNDGSSLFWGSGYNDYSNLPAASFVPGSSEISSVCWNSGSYAVLKADGSVVTWGDTDIGADTSAFAAKLASGVVEIVPHFTGFAARKGDGSVVVWVGSSEASPNPFGSGVTDLCVGVGAIAALKSNGSVAMYRYSNSAADSTSVASQLSSGVTAIYTTGEAFAALKSNGSVVAWGDAGLGGSTYLVSNLLSGGVTTIVPSNSAFAALKSDGSVVAWGNASLGGTMPNLYSGVTALYANNNGFAALKSDGSVVAWGGGAFEAPQYVFASVASRLASGVTAVYPGYDTFAAIKNDGSLVTWGGSGLTGADSSAVASQFTGITLPLTVQVRLAAGESPGTVAGDLTIACPGADTKTIALSGEIQPPPSISSSVTSLGGFSALYDSASEAQTLVVSGSDLLGDVTVTATARYQVSLDGDLYETSLSLPASDLPVTLYVRLGASSVTGAASGTLKFTSPSAVEQTVELSGNVPAPTITQSVIGIDELDSTYGLPSAAKSLTISGTNLVGPVLINAPTGFEISADGTSYVSELSVPVASLPATIYVRLMANLEVEFYSGYLTATSLGAGKRYWILSGEMTPRITASSSQLAGFQATLGQASPAKTITVDGAGLRGPLSLAAPAGFEISLDGVNFTSSLQLDRRVTTVKSNPHAMAALRSDGSVVTWGVAEFGGDSSAVSSQLSSGVVALYSNEGAFVALKNDGSIVTWGSIYTGGDSSAVSSQLMAGVTKVYSTSSSFAALKSNGSVVTWGSEIFGGDSTSVASQLSSDVTAIYSTLTSYAALKSNGSVITWGGGGLSFESGGDSSSVAAQLGSNVVSIYSTMYAFAALKSGGSVVTWGGEGLTYNAGGDSSAVSSQLLSGVSSIHASQFAFAALKNDGSVVTWGDNSAGGDSSSVSSSLQSNVVKLFSTKVAFAALKGDGSVVTWGAPSAGGDSSSVAGDLSSGIGLIFATDRAFAAVKLTPGQYPSQRIITWGDPEQGGDASYLFDSPRLEQSIFAPTYNGGIFNYVDSIVATPSIFFARTPFFNGGYFAWGSLDQEDYPDVVSLNSSFWTVPHAAIFGDHAAFAILRNDGSVMTFGSAPEGGDSSLVAEELAPGPPNLPLTLHIRLAAGAPLGAVSGNLTITSPTAQTQTVSLTGTVSAIVTHTHQELWRFENFGSYDSAANGADAADPDGDGMNNLLEYALGLDPNSSGVMPAVLGLNGASLEYTYTRSAAAKDNGVTYQIEWSDTLEVGSWSAQTVTEQIQGTEGALETVKASVPAGSGGKRFLRLRVAGAVGVPQDN